MADERTGEKIVIDILEALMRILKEIDIYDCFRKKIK